MSIRFEAIDVDGKNRGRLQGFTFRFTAASENIHKEGGFKRADGKHLSIDSPAGWLVMTSGSGLHIFDEAGLLGRLNGNDTLARNIARMFLDKAPDYISVIEKNLAERNLSAVRNQAHSLKGAAVTLGADRLAALAGELEKPEVLNGPDRADQAMRQLAAEFEFLVSALTERGWMA